MKYSNFLKNLSLLALGATYALTGTAFAEREKAGNGGNAGVCFSSAAEVKRIHENDNQIANDQISKIVSIQALELYQAKAHFLGQDPALHYVFAKPGEDGMNYVKRIASRFQTTLPDLQDAINQYAAQFNAKKNMYYTEGGIERIYDTAAQYYLDPSKCVVATLIRRTNVGNTAELEFDWRLFNHRAHNNVSRGVLMLHEVIYKWATDLKQTDSYNTRQLIVNALISRDVTRKEVIDELANDGFKVDSTSWNKTGEYRLLGSISKILDQFENGFTSQSFLYSVAAITTSNGLPNITENPRLWSVRGTMLRIRSENRIFTLLPHPILQAARELDAKAAAIQARIKRCKERLARSNKEDKHQYYISEFTQVTSEFWNSERSACRKEMPQLPERLKEAQAVAAAKHSEAVFEEKEIQSKADGLTALLNPVFEAEYTRLSAQAIEALNQRIDLITGQAWFSPEVADELRERSQQVVELYRLLRKDQWGAVRAEAAIFAKSWKLNPVIPVNE